MSIENKIVELLQKILAEITDAELDRDNARAALKFAGKIPVANEVSRLAKIADMNNANGRFESDEKRLVALRGILRKCDEVIETLTK